MPRSKQFLLEQIARLQRFVFNSRTSQRATKCLELPIQ
jgi:hypothetical protein